MERKCLNCCWYSTCSRIGATKVVCTHFGHTKVFTLKQITEIRIESEKKGNSERS